VTREQTVSSLNESATFRCHTNLEKPGCFQND